MFRDRIPHARTTRAPFARDERGAVLVLWALFLAVAFGFLALAFDLGRIATTQTQLQSFADQVALAAAGELDGRTDSITRATTAANQLIDGQQTYANGSQALGGSGDYTLTFLSTLPASDTVAATSVTADGRLARYVRVNVNLRTVLTPFAHVNAVLNGGSQISAGITASATAGFTSFACDITPLFFCVPNNGWRADANKGRQIEAVSGSSGGGAWTPGNFGFLELQEDPNGPCAGLGAGPRYRCLAAAERGITTCIQTTKPFVTRPGQASGLTEAFNARFDIYQGPVSSFRTDNRYRPAPNVMSDQWGAGAPNLPSDTCIAAGTCRFGTGDWNRNAYLTTYHANQWPIASDPNAASRPPRASATRYDVYRAEVDAARARNDAGMPTASGFGTMGRPGNHTGAQTAQARAALNPDRRIITAAAVDCGNQSMNGRSNVTALEYVKLFMTEPVRNAGSDSRIRAEIVGTAGGAGSGAVNGVYQDFVQLYR
jgi:Flp pilus assembly protein TadG